MAVKTSTPWWISGILAWGLLCLFAGLRVLAHLETVSMVLTVLGVLCVAAATGVRAWAYLRESGNRRAVERLLLLCHVGVIAALLVYFFLDSSKGQHMLGLGAKSKAPMIGTFLWLILLGASFIPMIMVELSLGFTGRDWFPAPGEKVADEAAVELYRVKEMATSGLTVALAAAFLMVTCNTMKDRDWRKDVSYFKTSAPGSATANMAKSLSEPLHVLVFFPPVNEVADEIENYFGDLNDKAGNVVVQRIDRDLEPALAEAFKVTADGTVVLVKGKIPDEEELEKAKTAKAKDPKAKQPEIPQNEKLTLPTDIQKARRDKLRDLDSDVQKSLMKVIRAKRVAYFSVGHGEINDPKSAGPTASMDPSLRASVFKQIVQLFNYDVKDWDGFGKPVPDDCTILFVLAPHNPLMDEEEAAIDDYLEHGGSLFIAFDPKGEASLGPKLQGRLGVKWLPDVVEDDKEFLVARHNDSDHKLILTNQFSSHASVTSLGRGGVRSGILLLESGHLDDADFMVEKGQETPKRTYVVHSMSTAYLDLNKNDQYDKDTEKRDRYNIVASIEDPSRKKAKPKEGIKDNGMRAMVFADGDIFTDPALERVGLLRALEADAILWLGGEEDLAGETVSEKDVMVEHTKSEDVVYFYLSLVGAPVLFLGVGLGGVLWRRRRAQRRQS